MKKVNNVLGRMEASLNGSLDGLQLDNTCDVIEKSLVIEMVNDLMMLVNEARTEVNNFSSNPVLSDEICPYCKRTEPCAGSYPEGCFHPKGK
jgi:hypothetical protein